MREKLEQIAALVREVNGSDYHSIMIACGVDGDRAKEIVAELVALGGKRSGQLSELNDCAILSVSLYVGGVEFRAQYSRPLTDEEREALANAKPSRGTRVVPLVMPW
jgi:hypothetical protein